MRKHVPFWSLAFVVAVVLQSCSNEAVKPKGNPDAPAQNAGNGALVSRLQSENLALGNPSNAATNLATPANYLLDKLQYAVSYNRDAGKSNWVAWHLDPTWLGSAPRQDNFAADPTLPTGWYRVTSGSYTGSGFDRGHNCPSADRTFSVADNSATFLMTNMMPQAPVNNQQTWAGLENYQRTLVNQGNEIYVVCGSYGSGGTGSNGFRTSIDNGRVVVPNRLWKAMVIIPRGDNDLARVTTGSRVIAVNMPNTNSQNTAWGTYRTTVDAIEAATGYDLFSALPTAVQSVIEARVDNGPTR